MTVELRARPTTYNGIEMRSRLEARVAAWLDDEGLRWKYEPRAFASGALQYLPDFVIEGISDPLGRPRTFYLEVKGTQPDMGPLVRKMRVVLATDPDAGLLIGIAHYMEMGLYRVIDGGWGMLFSCPHHKGYVFLGASYGETFAGRCTSGCEGVAQRPEDTSDHRLRLPKWAQAQ